MKTNNYHRQKNILFALIATGAISYIVLIATLFGKVFTNLRLHIAIVEACKYGLDSLLGILSPVEWILAIAIVALTIVSAIKFMRATFTIINTLHIVHRSVNFVIQSSPTSREKKAFTYGLLHPRIYISNQLTAELNSAELNAVFLHEQYHQINRDPLQRIIIENIARMLPPFPGKQALFTNFYTLTELSADEYALSQTANRKDLAGALFKMLNTNIEPMLGTSGFSMVADRVAVLVGHKPYHNRSKLYLCLGVGLVLLNFILIVQPISANEIITGAECHAPQFSSEQGTSSKVINLSPAK